MRWTQSRWSRGLVGTLVLTFVLQGIWSAALGVAQSFPRWASAGPPPVHPDLLPPGAQGSSWSILGLLAPPVLAQGADPLIFSTPEADLNDPFLMEQAAALGYDAEAIFSFVRDEIGFESYDGSLRGALWSRASNALDRASLLVGKPVSIGHFVDTWTPGLQMVYTVTRHTYSPYLLIGQNDTDLSDDGYGLFRMCSGVAFRHKSIDLPPELRPASDGLSQGTQAEHDAGTFVFPAHA